jgi:DNA helicase-2/ATP-dependent DNA helicase PcrA
MTPHTAVKHKYLEDLNPRQAEAVSIPGGPILVIAGAGSGKTRTVVYRVAWLLEHGIDSSSILLLTFTRKASQEMLSRAAELFDARASLVAGGTFHSIGNLLLRRYSALIGYEPGFAIMDQADTFDALDHAKANLNPPLEDAKGFPKSRTIAEVMSRSVGGAGSVAEVLEKRHPHFLGYARDIERVLALYREHKRTCNLMDYDDLLVNAIRLLEENEHVRTKISDQWQHILVDEYQDTNRLQAKMVRLLASQHDNVMVVGDDSQSIYSFRGADFANILEFPDIFPGTRIIKLEENYRSTPQILKVTNSLIQRAAIGYPKRLFSRGAEGPLPLVVRPATERDQSRFVLKCIEELYEHGVKLNEIAVLFRAGFHSFDLEGELTRNQVPYVKYGGFKFLESIHIKDVLSHLRVIQNPKDQLSWMRILKLLPRIGLKTAANLAATIAENGIDATTGPLTAATKKYSGLKDLLGLIWELTEHRGPISEKVERITEYYYPFLKERYDNYPKRMRDLDHLANITASYKSLNRFLSDMALEPPEQEDTGIAASGTGVVLSTIHSAKGLEWHTVILLWAAEGKIPTPQSLLSPEDLEEERRLLYVATTRAKHNLVVTAPQTFFDRRMGVVVVRLSRFFEEVPTEYFRYLRF